VVIFFSEICGNLCNLRILTSVDVPSIRGYCFRNLRLRIVAPWIREWSGERRSSRDLKNGTLNQILYFLLTPFDSLFFSAWAEKIGAVHFARPEHCGLQAASGNRRIQPV